MFQEKYKSEMFVRSSKTKTGNFKYVESGCKLPDSYSERKVKLLYNIHIVLPLKHK